VAVGTETKDRSLRAIRKSEQNDAKSDTCKEKNGIQVFNLHGISLSQPTLYREEVKLFRQTGCAQRPYPLLPIGNLQDKLKCLTSCNKARKVPD